MRLLNKDLETFLFYEDKYVYAYMKKYHIRRFPQPQNQNNKEKH